MRFWVKTTQISCAVIGRVCFESRLCLKSLNARSFVSCITPLCAFHSVSCTLNYRLYHRPVISVEPSWSQFGSGDLLLRRLRQTLSTMDSNRDQQTPVNFQEYDVFGFDLDHTIAKYKLVALFNVAYECVTTFLVNERGYDASIKDDLHKYKDFICKGLFLDASKGNILKLSYDGTILRATHGTHLLSKAQIQAVYGKEMKWGHAEAVKKTLRNVHPELRFFENYFDCPGLVATARIIDIIDQKSMSVEEKEKLYTKAWEDTLASLHYMYEPGHFAAGKGGFFSEVKKDPKKFVEECSLDIRRWLKSLRQPGKIVFLLTSSYIDFAACLLEVCLGEDWQSYFDISLFQGRKPGFFSDSNPFCALDQYTQGAVVTDLQRDGCYSQGNIQTFNKFLFKELGKEELKVLYFGDNICSDCYPSKHFAGWDTVLILEEMDAEGYICSDDTVPGHQSNDEQVVEPGSKKRKILEHSSLVTQEEMDYLITEFWGPFLVHEEDKSSPRLNTFWGDVVHRYSDIAVPSLEYLAGVPLNHNFERFTGDGTSTTGYHPGRPSSLLP